MLYWVCLTVLLGLCLAQNDRTMMDKAKGADVVAAVVDRIQKSCIFENDKMLLMRIALIETKYGEDSKTFRSGYYGGIWQVDEEGFNATKTLIFAKLFVNIKREFNIDWTKSSWSDLRKPMYSGLAARLRIKWLGISGQGVQKIPWSIDGQATFWKYHYTNDKNPINLDQFQSLVEQYETVCNAPSADLYFVLDSSSSIGSSNFAEMKRFVEKMVSSFKVGPKAVRIGLITYNRNPLVRFNLELYTQASSIIEAIRSIRYSGSGTKTSLALDKLRDEMEEYARSTDSGVPRVAIVLTDGRSSNEDATKAAARSVHADDITVFAVGVGSRTDQEELDAIGSDPDCLHVFNLVSFDDIPHFKNEITRRSCRVSAIVNQGSSFNGSLEFGQAQYFTINVNASGVTFKVSMTSGSIIIYISYTIRNPSAAFNDFSQKVDGGTAAIFVPSRAVTSDIQKRSTDEDSKQAYAAIVGGSQKTMNSFRLDTLIGDQRGGASDVILSLTLTFMCCLLAFFI